MAMYKITSYIYAKVIHQNVINRRFSDIYNQSCIFTERYSNIKKKPKNITNNNTKFEPINNVLSVFNITSDILQIPKIYRLFI